MFYGQETAHSGSSSATNQVCVTERCVTLSLACGSSSVTKARDEVIFKSLSALRLGRTGEV